MSIYIICFSLSTFLLYLSEKVKLNKIIRNIVIIIALLLPCFLAAFRADSIGTDVLVYVKPIYTIASDSTSIKEFFSMSWYRIWRDVTILEFEPGFTLLVYFVTKITHSFSFVLGVIELFIIVPIYFALSKAELKLSIWFGMLTYYFLFFNVSLNLMRQMIACSICLLAYTYLIKKDIRRYLLYNILAFFFHRMAILGFVILGIYLLIIHKNEQLKNTKKRYKLRLGSISIENHYIRTIGLLVICLMSLFALPLIKNIMEIIGLSGYKIYLNGRIRFMPNQVLLRIPLLYMYIYIKKYVKDKNSIYYFFLATQLVELVLSQISGAYEQAIRMVYFFSIINVLIIPYICSISYKGNILLKKLYFTIYLIVYWIYQFIYSGAMETYPYILR